MYFTYFLDFYFNFIKKIWLFLLPPKLSYMYMYLLLPWLLDDAAVTNQLEKKKLSTGKNSGHLMLLSVVWVAMSACYRPTCCLHSGGSKAYWLLQTHGTIYIHTGTLIVYIHKINHTRYVDMVSSMNR